MASTTLLTSTTAGSIFTAEPPFSIHTTQAEIRRVINPLLVQTELRQPEGTPLELRITGLSNAAQLAARMNTQWRQGKLKDMPTGERVIPWPRAQGIAMAQGTTLVLRWRKGQAFTVPLIWSIVIIAAAIAAFLLIRRLMGASWSLSKVTAGQGSTSSTGPLGLPWWKVVVYGGLLGIGGPFIINEVARYKQAETHLHQVEHPSGGPRG